MTQPGDTPPAAAEPGPGPDASPAAGSDGAGLELDPDRRLSLRVVTMPRDQNPYGTIFGGVIMSYIDQAGMVEALNHANATWVTASIERIDFRAPVFLGDIVSFFTRTERTGTSSVRVGVDVVAEARDTGEKRRVTTATLTMVALDRTGRPTPFREAPPALVHRPAGLDPRDPRVRDADEPTTEHAARQTGAAT